ncbi:MAG: hypothetical protein K1X94_26130 [Sandaracinaceae bacterium]|nr:hypothetical protein [Sandaracinaceae bacterium]
MTIPSLGPERSHPTETLATRRARPGIGATLAGLVSLLVTSGCAGTADEPASTSTSAASEREPALVLGTDAQRLYERLLVRDGAPSCAALVEGVDEPVAPLLEITERVTAPPSAGMRAAECLLEDHALELEPTLTGWVTHEATMGFALLVLDHLDTLDPALGERLARAALAGENAERARTRIARSERHHALAETSEPTPSTGGTR